LKECAYADYEYKGRRVLTDVPAPHLSTKLMRLEF
jgi:hypothetical protein